MSVKILCITRKYPPEVGGMENFCYNVFNGIQAKNKETKIVALGKKQINLQTKGCCKTQNYRNLQ